MTSIDLIGNLEYQSENSRLQSDVAGKHAEVSGGLTLAEIAQMIVTLFIVTVGVGLLITVTYIVTFPVIAKHEQAKTDALKTAAGLLQFVNSVVPDAASVLKSGTWQNNSLTADYYCLTNKDGTPSYAIISYAKGYSSTLKVLTGIDNEGKIVRINVLEQGETPGLGDQVQGDEFKKQFEGAHKTKLKVSTSGGADAIQAITAATISSRAITEDAVKNAMKFYEQELAGK
jgi:Na+-translocating ferredoxin:NAD+ oxidoreductase subunit G